MTTVIFASQRTFVFALASVLTLLLSPAHAQTTLYTDSFSGAGGPLNGALVEGGALQTGAVAWSANSPFLNNGSIDGATEGSAILPFTPAVNAQYTLSMDVSNTTDRWVGLGFKNAPLGTPGGSTAGDRFSNGGGLAWMLYRDHASDPTQDIQLFAGLNTANGIADTNPAVNFAQPNNLKIIIDTTGAGTSFTADFFLNNVSISGGPQVVNQPISNIQYAGLTFDNATAAPISFDNFLLTELITGVQPNAWIVDGGGNFTPPGNWSMGTPTAGSTVLFGGALTAANAPAVVTLDAPASLAEVQFNNTAGSYVIAGPSTLTLTGSATVAVLSGEHEISATVAGAAGLIKTGAGGLYLNANNTYTGQTDVQAGALRLRHVGAVDGDASVAAGASLVFHGDAAASGQGYNGGFAGDISGAGDVQLSGTLTTETVTFTSAKTYTGVTSVIGGTLQLSGAGRPGAADGTAATRTVVGGNQTTGKISLNGGAAVGNEVLVLSARELAALDAVHLASTGANSWAGNIKGDLGGSNYNIESTSGALTLGGTLSAPDSGVRNFVFSGAGNTNITGKLVDLATDADGNPLAGPVNAANNVNVIKRGAGTLTISTASNLNDDYWLGATTVEGGTLEVVSNGANDGELKSATIDVRAGATLDIDDFGTYALQVGQRLGGGGTIRATGGTVAVFDDNHLAPGDGVGTLTVNGNMTLSGVAPGGSLNYDLGNATTVGGAENDLIQVSGSFSTSGTPTMTLNVSPVEGDLAAGSYRLISHTGGATTTSGITPQMLSNTGAALNPRQTLAVNGSTAGQVNLVVTGSEATLTWNGTAGNNSWDVDASANWTGADSRFRDLDDVTFGAGGVKSATVNASVAPGSVIFNGGAGSTYTLTGSGGMTGHGPMTVNSGTVRLLNTGNNYAGTTTVANGARLEVVGASVGDVVVHGNLAVTNTLSTNFVDTFSGTLGAYTNTRILDANGGGSNAYAWQISGGRVEIATAAFDGIEQTALTRTDQTLEVGEELRAEYTHENLNTQDIGLYVGAGAPTMDVRQDYVSVYVRNNGDVLSRGFDGATEFPIAGVPAPESIVSLFVARTATDAFELGYYDGDGARNVVTTRTISSGNAAGIGNAIGLYSDVRGTGVRGDLDNLSISTGSANHVLSIDGDVTLSATGTLELDISAAGFTSLDVAGAATLAGTLDVDLLDGFMPSAGASYNLVAAAGEIDATGLTFNLPVLAGGLSWDTSQFGTLGVLSVASALPGDFDADGDVDQADLADWRANFGAANDGADADGDGDSDGADFLAWQRNLGAGPAAAAAAAVPEPTTGMLMGVTLAGAVALAFRRNGRSS